MYSDELQVKQYYTYLCKNRSIYTPDLNQPLFQFVNALNVCIVNTLV